MVLTISRLVVLAMIASAVSSGAEEPSCSAAARQCEQQIRQMLSGRRYLGATIEERNPGLVIKSLNPDGPAARSGLQVGDRLVAVNGKPLTQASAREFKQLVAAARETGRLTVIVHRNGAYIRVFTRLEPYSKEHVEKILAAHVSQSHPSTAGGN